MVIMNRKSSQMLMCSDGQWYQSNSICDSNEYFVSPRGEKVEVGWTRVFLCTEAFRLRSSDTRELFASAYYIVHRGWQ